MAKKLGLDLVEISPNSDPPVCKIIDYSKFKYTQKKKQKSIRSNAQKQFLKKLDLVLIPMSMTLILSLNMQ